MVINKDLFPDIPNISNVKTTSGTDIIPIISGSDETLDDNTYIPCIATGRRKFKQGDSLDPRIRTDENGTVYVKSKYKD